MKLHQRCRRVLLQNSHRKKNGSPAEMRARKKAEAKQNAARNKTEHTAPPKRNQQKLAKIEQACTTLRQKIFHRNAKSKVFEHGLDDPAS